MTQLMQEMCVPQDVLPVKPHLPYALWQVDAVEKNGLLPVNTNETTGIVKEQCDQIAKLLLIFGAAAISKMRDFCWVRLTMRKLIMLNISPYCGGCTLLPANL